MLDSIAVEGCEFGLSRERLDEVRMGVIARVAKLVELDGSQVRCDFRSILTYS